MLFELPALGEPELEVVGQVDELRERLRRQLREPRRWSGSLRRMQFARAVQASNTIEGYEAALDDAAAIDLGEDPIDVDEETHLAVRGYRDAMTFVLQLADEDVVSVDEQLLKSLHFMMTSYDLANRPGRWRAGQIFVRDEATDEIVYRGPDVEDVPVLMRELADALATDSGAPAMVRAAMAHLNLVMIHPFRDGNGRMGRCLQTLVLAREGVLSPEFCSIEEHLGRHTEAYYRVLRDVGAGSWQPERDARPWIRFTLVAHLRQAQGLISRTKESEELWESIERRVRAGGLPERTVAVLWDAAMGYRVRNATYRAILDSSAEDPISEGVASRDLRALVEVGLLESRGEKRGRHYLASGELRELRLAVLRSRDPQHDVDPFEGRS